MTHISTAREAEINAADQMRFLGYPDARPTPIGPDGGIDVSSTGALAQVKWKSSLAGRPDLQRLYGARGSQTHKSLFFFASSGYSRHAIAYADEHQIHLFTYAATGIIQPQNRLAGQALNLAQRTTGHADQLQAISLLKEADKAAEQAKEARGTLGCAAVFGIIFFFITKQLFFSDWSPTSTDWAVTFWKVVVVIIDIFIILGTLGVIIDMRVKKS